MSLTESAPLARQHTAELRDLKRLSGGSSWFLFAGGLGGIVLIVCFLLFVGYDGNTFAIRAEPSNHSQWLVEYLDREQELYNFLWFFALPPERAIFEAVSDSVLSSAAVIADTSSPLSITSGGGSSVSFWTRFVLWAHLGLVHLLFIFLISWRCWVAYVLWVWVKNCWKQAVHNGDDLLGQMGNGNLFYSGARTGLFNMTEDGAPDVQVRGLACPPEASEEEALASRVNAILERYGAISETNKALTRYILADPRIPAFASGMNQDRIVERMFEGCSLREVTEMALERALFLHSHYIAENYDDDSFYADDSHHSERGGISVAHYASKLLSGFHSVLTDAHRDSLRSFSPSQIATIILAVQAGKLLAFSFEGGRWAKTSAFPELCSRAVLHSVVAYGRELDFYEREDVRQAIIFGSRFSLMGPIRMPMGMSPRARAARQWVELMLADPHELAASVDEVELVGIVSEVHAEWSVRFAESLQRGESTAMQGCCVGPSSVLFMPVRNLLTQMREILPIEWIDRIGELVSLVSQKQRLVMMSAELNADSSENKSIPAYQRILSPISYQDRKILCDQFGLEEDEVRDWCTLRVIFNSHGWLARRVGSRSVPESSIIFCVLKIDHDQFPSNEKGKVGLEAVVPLRGNRLESSIGRGWATIFPEAATAKLALTKEEYNLFLDGRKSSQEADDEFLSFPGDKDEKKGTGV